jgi:hydrogenase maturation protease
MSPLNNLFRRQRAGRICFMGMGNPDYGDDGFGLQLANELMAAGVQDVIAAGTTPEQHLDSVADEGFADLVFLDAVEFGAEAGSVVLLGRPEMQVHFPQISTHKISLGALAQLVESNGKTRVWLLGVQPESLRQGQPLSPAVRRTTRILKELLLQHEPEATKHHAAVQQDAGVHA